METFFWSFGGSIIGFLIGLLVRNWIEKRKEKIENDRLDDESMGIRRIGGYHWWL